MDRRALIALIGAVPFVRPLRSFAQQQTALIGFLNSRAPTETADEVTAFRKGLAEGEFFESKNIRVEYRWAEGRFDRLPALAGELVSRGVQVIAALGGEPSVSAARLASKTTPIVFAIGGNPVEAGFVDSLNRPGGNITGVSLLLTEMEGKRLGLLREMVPTGRLVAVLLNPAMGTFDGQRRAIEEAGRALGQTIHVIGVQRESEIDAAFAEAASMRADAVLVGTDPFMISRRDQLTALAARYAIPAVYPARQYATAGGLMSYGVDIAEAYRQVGIYTARILKGEKPGDLPVQQATKFEFVINLKTSKALGIDIPANLSARADEVIE
jgi:putative tryptophan/tyrosine transport system substrate-binding protein